jgi:hypothetical protein
MDEDFIKLKAAYQNARKPINDQIREQETKNLKLKEAVIEQVKLINDEDSRVCIQKYQKLKRSYQDIGPAGKKNEPNLWKILNESADRFYEAEKSIANDELKIIESLAADIGKDGFSISKTKDQIRELSKTRKSPEFLKLQKSLKAFEGQQAQEIISKKITSYQDLPALLELETIENTSIEKEIVKALIKPTYSGDVDKIKEAVVMMELMAGVDCPAADKAIKQKLTLEMLQNKFSQGLNESEKLKGLLLVIINNLQAKKLSAPESKLWKRAQIALNNLAKHLP